MSIEPLIFLFVIVPTIFISMHFLKKKIRHTLWFLKIRYVFRIVWRSIILLGLAYAFVSTAFAYLTYPKYMATIDGYYEYNTTSDEGIKNTVYNTIYRFEVGKKRLRITDKKTATSIKPKKGKRLEVLYKDGDFMVYNPILFLVVSLIGTGVFYYLVYLIKSDFVKKPLMQKKSFWIT